MDFNRPMDTPILVQFFDTLEQAQEAFKSFAKEHKFGPKTRDTQRNTKGITFRRKWECELSGEPDKRHKHETTHQSKQRKRKPTKINCPFRAIAQLDEATNKWVVETTEEAHNHGPLGRLEAAPSFRRGGGGSGIVDTIKIMNQYTAGSSPQRILAVLLEEDPNCPLTAKDIQNIVKEVRQKELLGKTPIQWLHDTLSTGGYQFRFDVDVDGCIDRFFFCHEDNIKFYKRNPDILMLDGTYSVCKFKMTMLNIGGVTSNNMNLSIGVCFLRQETTEYFTWAMEKFDEMLTDHDIQHPEVIVTDRELAMLNALEKTFPAVPHILCQWHVRKNVENNTRGCYPRPEKGHTLHPKHEEFMAAWELLMSSPDEQTYNGRLNAFQNHAFPQKAVDYCKKTWLIWKEKLVTAWVDKISHFRNKNTSRLEGSHKHIKDWIGSANCDLKTVWERLMLFWKQQIRSIEIEQSRQQRARDELANKEDFVKIRGFVFDNCIRHIWNQIQRLLKDGTRPVDPCTRNTKLSMGIPCSHNIFMLREQNRPFWERSMLHPHWFIDRPPPGHVFNDDEQPIIRNPKMRNNKTDQLRALKKAQKGKKRRGAKGADRILSSFENECNDYAPAPTYEDQQTAVLVARRQLTLEEIAEKHRKQRLERLAALTIVPVPDQIENSPNSFVFSRTDAHPSMRAFHREAAPSPTSNRPPVTTTTTTSRPVPAMAQGQHQFQLEQPQLRQTTLTQQPQLRPILRALNQPNRTTTTPAPRLPIAPPRFASNYTPSNTSSPLRNLLPSPATPVRQFRQPLAFDTPIQPQFQRASIGSIPSFTQQFADGAFTQAGGHTSTQLGLKRLRTGPDSYVPGTRPPRACDIPGWKQRQEAQADAQRRQYMEYDRSSSQGVVTSSQPTEYAFTSTQVERCLEDGMRVIQPFSTQEWNNTQLPY